MAKDKTKGEAKADIVDKEAEIAATGKADKVAGAVKGKSKGSKKAIEPAKATNKNIAKSQTQTKTGTKAIAEAPKVEEEKSGTTKESDQTAAEADQKTTEEITPRSDTEASATTEKLAKSGKRSAKALKEIEEKQAKESRIAAQSAKASSEGGKSAKVPPKPARSKLERRGKNYRKLAKLIDKTKAYSLSEALELAVNTSPAKFDATVELHVRLGIDPRLADQNLRDTVVLPAGSGKNVRVAVFCEADDVMGAEKSGADIAAGDEFLQKLDKEELDFDVLIATPKVMGKLGKYARLLGPKGLMPNPKSGTVTTDVAKAVSEAKGGRVEYRVDSTGIVHVGVGKVSFGKDKLTENTRAILASIKANKPSSLKSTYVQAIYATTTMGPSIEVSASEV